MTTSSPARPLSSYSLLSPSSSSGDVEGGLNPSNSPHSQHSAASGGKQTYQDAFTQRQRKNDFYSIAKLKLTAKNLVQKSREMSQEVPQLPSTGEQSPQAQPKQQQRNCAVSDLPKRSDRGNRVEEAQYLTPIQTSHSSYSNGTNHDHDDDDAADTDSNHSLPIDLSDDPPILPIHKIPAEKKSPMMVKKDFVPFAPKVAVVVKEKENDLEDEVESNFAPPPVPLSEDKRPMLHDELIREIRNGRDTPGQPPLPVFLLLTLFSLRGKQLVGSTNLLAERTQNRQLGRCPASNPKQS
jgi:hypothetical protein